MIFFTADTHFCHSNIIHSCERPFDCVDEMNLALIKNWNSLVTRNDEVYILGDFLYPGSAREANEILSKLKGRKYLVKGNHEKYLTDPEFKSGAFEWIKDYYILKHESMNFVLFHFPLLSWYRSHYGSIHLYGHLHNSGIKNPDFRKKLNLLGPRAVNVGVDVNDFYPVSMYQIIEAVGDINI
ncbi:MAG: metallophosphoesterase [Treponema sp.]|nr:metallophosphoesterase [Treponema sp.]